MRYNSALKHFRDGQKRGTALWAGWLLALAILPRTGAMAGQADQPDNPAPPAASSSAANLLAQADRLGHVRIIVTLHQTDGDAALLARLPPDSVTVLSRFATLPAFVADATAAGVAALLADPAVARIAEDRIARPQAPP